MPHLMFETFFSQFFWLTLLIFSLYYILVSSLIPKVSNAYKARKALESGVGVNTKGAEGSTGANIAIEVKAVAYSSSVAHYTKALDDSRQAWSKTI